MNIDIVEQLARMDLIERDQFIKDLVWKWPHMALSLSNSIGLQLQIQDRQKEEAYD